MGNNSKLPVQTRYSAYVADGMILLQSKFNGVLTEMEEANRAIENAGIEGISPIEIAYTRARQLVWRILY